MRVTVQKLPKSEVKLTIALEPAELATYVERSVADFSRELKVPGFRPGHIPREVVEQKVGKDAIHKHAAELAVPHFTAQAIQQEKLPVVARPHISITNKEPLTFEVLAALLPEVKLKNYKDISIPKKETVVTEKEVEEELRRIQKAYATFHPVDRPAKQEDRIEIDFEGSEKGVVLEQLQSKNHPIILGDEMLVPGFEEQIVGMKKGETKEFDVTFPKNHPQEKWRGRKVHFKVTMQGVSEVVLPEWTTEFLKKISGTDKTLETLKAEIRDAMLREKVLQEQERRENELIEALLKKATIDLPGLLVREEIDFMKQETTLRLEKQGLTWERYEAAMKSRGRDLEKELQKEAERRLQARRLIEYLLEQEKITVSSDELDKEQSRILQGRNPQELKMDLEKVRMQLAHTLKVRHLFSQFLPN